MDGFKERFVHLHGDRWLERGIAVLLLEGPGQFEAAALGIHFSVEAWQQTGTAVMDWVETRSEIDAARVGWVGSSFGTFFSTIAAAYEPRIKACAIHGTCLEPGGETIFQHAHPFFKLRFMYMSGYTDEAKFDQFRKSITWEGHAEKIRMPFLCIAGEMDDLSPLPHTDRLFTTLACPRRLVVYQGGGHQGGAPSAALGPYFPTLIADWMDARLNDQPFKSERWYVDARGGIARTAY
jgi:dipeptidyl aminopeptidase/acylaminoacyl peptidase